MPEAAGGYRAVLRNRDYRLLLSGLAISQLGSWTYSVALAVFVFTATRSPTAVAIASLTRFGTALLVSVYGGVVAERFERVRLMVLLDVVSLLLMASLAVVAGVNGPVALAIALAALTSAVASIYSPAVKATIPTVVGADHLAAANALEGTVENLAVIAGPAIGAALLLLGSPAIAFAVNAASFGYSALVVMRLHSRSEAVDVTEGGDVGPLQQILAGIRAIGSSPTVVLLVGFAVVASFIYGSDTVLLIVLSRDVLGTGADGYGYLLAGLGLGGAITAVFMNRLATSRRLGTLIATGMLVFCLPTALFVIVHSAPAGFAIEVVRGAGTIVVDVLAITALQRLVPSHVVARVFGVFFAFVLAATALGAIITPALLTLIGRNATLLVFGFAVPAIVLLIGRRVRALDSAALTQLAAIEPRVQVLQRLAIFEGATRASLEQLARVAVEEHADSGIVIVREGEPADDFFVLVAGEVKVSAHGEKQRGHSLGRLQPPAYFGEIGLLERVPRTATVTATQPCTLYRIDGAAFIDALNAVTLSPSALGLTRGRLQRTHPSRSLQYGGAR